MRYIKKSTEPSGFTYWKNKPSRITKGYKHLRGKVKKEVYKSLIDEQGGICAYCERSLLESHSEEYHIDHLNPQSNNAGDDLEYSNFLCSCLRDTAEGDPLHCGKLKDSALLPVHPLQQDCQSKFKFTADGGIDGLDSNAKKTIEILGLDIEKLRNMRGKALEPFLEPDIADDFIDFVKGYISITPDGKYNPFVSAVEYIFSS